MGSEQPRYGPGAKDPDASDVLYVEALTAPFTISTMPENTLRAFADHGRVGQSIPPEGGDADDVLREFAKIGIDRHALAVKLQRDGAEAFTQSWTSLLERIQEKAA